MQPQFYGATQGMPHMMQQFGPGMTPQQVQDAYQRMYSPQVPQQIHASADSLADKARIAALEKRIAELEARKTPVLDAAAPHDVAPRAAAAADVAKRAIDRSLHSTKIKDVLKARSERISNEKGFLNRWSRRVGYFGLLAGLGIGSTVAIASGLGVIPIAAATSSWFICVSICRFCIGGRESWKHQSIC
jgi:hypothetical protein